MFALVRRFKTIHVYQKADIPRTVSRAVLTDVQKRRPVLGDLALPRRRPDVAVCVQTSALDAHTTSFFQEVAGRGDESGFERGGIVGAVGFRARRDLLDWRDSAETSYPMVVFRAAAMSSIAACSGSLTSWPCSRWAAATLWVRLTMN
jgi:hypothetical protein